MTLTMKKIKNLLPLGIVVLYATLFVVISIFHEPWFDEAESWQIARCAGYKDLIFSIPHYEGHPPLWHLILSIPSKLNLPYEISLKSVCFIFCVSATALLVFKSPFPSIVKYTLPFTYFLFYQYGIVVRTYCVLYLAFVLVAITFKDKDIHPFRFALSLLLLCYTSAYGIAIAGGIAIAWVIDIMRGSKKISALFKDIRVYSLLVLLLGAIAVILLIIPDKETMAMTVTTTNGPLMRAYYAFFASYGDATLTDILSGYLQNTGYDTFSLILGGVMGMLVLGMLILNSEIKNIKYFIIPYGFMGGMLTILYFNMHHEGVLFLLLLFGAWISADSREKIGRKLINRLTDADANTDRLIKIKVGDINKLTCLRSVLIGAILIVSILWAIVASINDIRKPYSCGRQIAQIIKNNHWENEYIMAEWWENETIDSDGSMIPSDTNALDYLVTFLPYFNHELTTNLNPTEPIREYLVHRYSKELENANIEALKQMEKPGIIIGDANVNMIYDDLTPMDYKPVAEFYNPGFSIFKNRYSECNEYIYMRKDLLDKYNLKEINKEYVIK